jgi:hypothetical protein
MREHVSHSNISGNSKANSKILGHESGGSNHEKPETKNLMLESLSI